MDLIVTIGGILYGLMLILATFVRNGLTEAIRIDALILPDPSDATRPLNVVAGFLLVAYSGYSLLN
jgi:hypothetical protein